jgi:DNA-binding NarL/FixJ family response regulator
MADDIRLVIAEDHPLFRDALRRTFDKCGWVQVVAEAQDGPSALDHIRSLTPDVALLDIGLPRMNGLAVVRALRQERIPVKVVFLTIHDDEATFEAALEVDVRGYLLKDCTEPELVTCISAVAAGQHYTSPSMTTLLVNRTRRVRQFAEETPGLQVLTPQERSILKQIARDKTSKEIAQDMGIAAKTVDAHRSNICRKLEIHGQHGLARFAARHRLDL